MPVVATMAEAATRASQNVWERHLDATDNLNTLLGSWLSAIRAAIPEDNVAVRTVLNWLPVGYEILQSVPAAKPDQLATDCEDIAVYLHRTCRAIQYAQDGGRISSAQETALLASYNALWPV
jgi:hypothetical protein